MDRQTELELIDELIGLKAQKSYYLDESVTRNPVNFYTSEDHFERERQQIFRKLPLIGAHSSELVKAGDFKRKELAGLPVLLTRDKQGNANAFLNVCRHRGTRLVDDEKGCKNRFSCPYHAWTYANTGELIAAPHFDAGFEGVDKADLSLKRLKTVERFGFIWVMPQDDPEFDFEGYFEGLAGDLDALNLEDMVIVGQEGSVRKANWKLLVEGGIEAYHFRVAHRTTIGPHFEDNLSSYRMFGDHMRSILPRTSMAKLTEDTRESWRIRDHANVLYSMFPINQMLVQQDHIAWISSEPLSASESYITISLLAPKEKVEDTEHWARNKEITLTTLNEDFVIGESAQSVIASGANSDMLFGRFEGALDAFNKVTAKHLAAEASAIAAE